MVSEEVVKKAVETLRGFSPEVLEAAIQEIPDVKRNGDVNINVNPKKK